MTSENSNKLSAVKDRKGLPGGIKAALADVFTRPEFPAVPPGFYRENGLYIAGGIALFLILLFLRSWENLIHPGLYVEDATTYFNVYYGNQKAFSNVVNNSRGYIHLIGSVYAWLAAHAVVKGEVLWSKRMTSSGRRP